MFYRCCIQFCTSFVGIVVVFLYRFVIGSCILGFVWVSYRVCTWFNVGLYRVSYRLLHVFCIGF